MPARGGLRRRVRAAALLVVTTATALGGGIAVVAAAPASAASHAQAGEPTIEVYASPSGIVSDGSDLTVSVVVDNTGADELAAGQVTVSTTESPLADRAALADYTAHPGQYPQRVLAADATLAVAAGTAAVVATLVIPAAAVGLSSAQPGVFGLSADVTTGSTPLGTGTGTLVVPGATPASVNIAAVMPLTAPVRADGLISSQDLATYTGADGVLTRELTIAQRNPRLTLGIDPMVLASIRVLGSSAPQSAQSWLSALALLPNDSFPLQYADADPALQLQAGLSQPLAPTDFQYAMSAGNFGSPLTVGEPTATPTSPATPTATPTPPSQLPSLKELLDWPYTLSGIAWPASDVVSGSEVTALGRAGLPTTIVSGSNTNAATVAATPDAVLPVDGGTALVTDDGLSSALQAAATASNSVQAGVANAALEAQLALAASGAQPGGVVLVSLGRVWPTDASRAATAVNTLLDSAFSQASTIRAALTAPPTSGLQLTDKKYAEDRVDAVQELLDREGDTRAGGPSGIDHIASFSSVLQNPALLTGPVRAQVLSLTAVAWSGSSEWATAVAKELNSLSDSMSAVQIVSPGSIRQASRQALIPITVTNKLTAPIQVVLRATPSSARLEVDSDTEKTIPAGSSAKVLVPVKAQLGNGSVRLGLQLYSQTGVRIGDSVGATVDVHADWEGIGALIFGLVVVGFFGFGLFRTIQRRRREREAGTDASTEAPADPGAGRG